MALQRITTTTLSALRKQGRATDRDWHRIVAWLNEKREFGPPFAHLIAEPVYRRSGEEVDWYCDPISAHSSLAPLSSLPEPERQRVLDLVRRMLNRLLEESRRLQARGDAMAMPLLLASSVPEPLSDRVWWMASPTLADGGQAVVVDWGFSAEAPRVIGGDIGGVSQRIGQIDQPVPLPRHAKLGWVAAPLLWLPFAGVMLAIAIFLLEGCGIDGPRWGLSSVPGLSYCRPLESHPPPIPDRAWELAAEVKQLELALARRNTTCLAELPYPAPSPLPPPAAQAQPAPTPRPAPPDDRLRLPAGPTTDLSFLKGCWQSDPFKHTPAHAQPGISTYCFDATGRGTLVFKRGSANHECRLPARARTEGGKLFLDDADGQCSDGSSWWADHLVCTPDRAGVAVCSGSSQTDSGPSRWSVNLHKK